MNFKKIISISVSSFIISFLIISNIFVLINTPITFSGGCTKDELEGVEFIKKNLPGDSYFFTDLRLSSVLRTLTSVNTIIAPGYQQSTYQELNVTYHVFYGNNTFKALYSISDLIFEKKLFVKECYLLFSKLYTTEGITTMDYSFGPIQIETYNMYLNSSYFTVLFNNGQVFIVKAEILERDLCEK